jgi:hypothetical protein
MPVTIEELFGAARVLSGGLVNWGESIPETDSGVYVVSLANPSHFQISSVRYGEREYWNDGESIIYIGRAARLSRRLRQFYRHRHGDSSPHRGGEAVLLLDAPKLIHWAAVADYAGAESRLIEAFKARVGRMPFGNRVRSARLATGST